MPLNLPLMRDNITRKDLDSVIDFLRRDDPILTQSSNVRAFEKEWSDWLGVKHSVFVNSGASANLLTMAALRLRYPEGGEIVVPSLTWSSDVSSVLQAGFDPVFVDIDLRHLGMNTDGVIEALNERTRAVFLTHAQGFDALSEELLRTLKERKILLVEDVCESHGATHDDRKLGTFGWASNFSFYYAHHMSTIEGGMVCTDDSELYENLRILRSHGMVRESSSSELKERYSKDYPDLNPDFIFAFPAYNVRNTEIGAVIGRNQLSRLDSNNLLRIRNLRTFLDHLDSDRYFTEFKTEGNCNYAFNLILRKKDDDFVRRLTVKMKEEGVESRRGSAGGGNQLRQPYLRKIHGESYRDFPVTDHVHFYGFYLGNFPSLEEKTIVELCDILNSVE